MQAPTTPGAFYATMAAAAAWPGVPSAQAPKAGAHCVVCACPGYPYRAAGAQLKGRLLAQHSGATMATMQGAWRAAGVRHQFSWYHKHGHAVFVAPQHVAAATKLVAKHAPACKPGMPAPSLAATIAAARAVYAALAKRYNK